MTDLPEMKIKLDVFEGPLDLLLHLIQQMEIDIYDIPIAKITAQYMSYIHTMKEFELALAGEYLVMAATLMAIKSQTLLPTQELAVEDELGFEEDPRDELVAQLLEYRKYKYAAEKLSERADERSLYYTKDPMNVDAFKERDVALKKDALKPIDLFEAFHQLLERKKNEEKIETTITSEDTTIEERISFIKQILQQNQQGCSFTSFFDLPTKSEVVTTFMALLELMKTGDIVAKQDENYATIMLYPTVGDSTNEENQ